MASPSNDPIDPMLSNVLPSINDIKVITADKYIYLESSIKEFTSGKSSFECSLFTNFHRNSVESFDELLNNSKYEVSNDHNICKSWETMVIQSMPK